MKSLIGLFLIVFVLTLSVFSIQDAHAASMTFTTDTTITSQIIASGETWTINPGVTLTINSGVTINNSGTINNSNGGAINNFGNIFNSGTINNIGFLINHSGGSITNSNTINNSGNINNFSIITNSGTIINSFVIANSGIINQCGNGVYFGTLPTGNLIINITCCVPPVSGDWIVTSSCTLIENTVVAGNVIVQNNSLLTISSDTILNIDFKTKHLLVKSGSGVLIKSGGKIISICGGFPGAGGCSIF